MTYSIDFSMVGVLKTRSSSLAVLHALISDLIL